MRFERVLAAASGARGRAPVVHRALEDVGDAASHQEEVAADEAAVRHHRRVAPELAANITDARVIVGFRNVLTHEYAAVDDDAVYGVATEDLTTLRRECASLLARAE